MPTPCALPHARAALIACLVALLLVVAGGPSGAGGPPVADRAAGLPAQPAEALPVQVLLDGVEPAVVGPGTPWRVSGTVRNVGSEPVAVSQIRASTAYLGLDTRGDLDAWAAGEAGVTTSRVVGTDDVDTELAPGASASFAISVAGEEVAPPFDFATLPLAVEVLQDETPRGRVRTFLPWYAVESPTPTLSLSWVVPLTVPPDPRLSDPDSDVRSNAWVEAIGADSTVRTWLEGLLDQDATFVVDPALLAPVVPGGEIAEPPEPEEPTEPAAPTSEPTQDPTAPSPTGEVPTPGQGTGDPAPGPGQDDGGATLPLPSPSATTPDLPPDDAPEDVDEVQQAELALQDTLADLGEDRLWWLPVNDPDLAALLDLEVSAPLVQDQLATGLPESALLARPLLDQGRHDVAWPAWDRVPRPDLRRLVEVWPVQRDLSAVVVPDTALDVPLDSTAGTLSVTGGGESGRRADLTLLGYDTSLSGLLAQAPTPESDGETVQRMVAETLAVHQELGPATERSLALAPPRGTRVEAQTLASVVAAFEAAPWMRSTPAADLLTDAPEAELTGDLPRPPAPGDPTAYPDPGPSPLTSARIIDIESLGDTLDELAEILPTDDGIARWGLVLDGLYSTRWRLDASSWEAPLTDLHAQVDGVLAGVQVNPTQVNFLADEGLIQMTVVNTLPITVQDLTLNIEPGNARLRIIDQPDSITIGPDSRATVLFRARAVASGQVPVRAYLSTPGGLGVGEEQVLQVRVQPTGTWIYWVLGGVAGVILVLGLGRALRRTPTRAAEVAATAGTRPPTAEDPT